MSQDDLTFIERLVDRDVELRAFILRLIDPEDFGHAVNLEIRRAACDVLRIPAPHGTVRHHGAEQAFELDGQDVRYLGVGPQSQR